RRDLLPRACNRLHRSAAGRRLAGSRRDPGHCRNRRRRLRSETAPEALGATGPRASVKRVWKQADAVERDCGWGVELDGKPLRTPARDLLTVPTKALAEAIASEWNEVGDKIDPGTLPLTGLANAAVDRVAPDKEAFATGVARYADADLACYRAEGPSAPVDRQTESWDALIGWGRRRF